MSVVVVAAAVDARVVKGGMKSVSGWRQTQDDAFVAEFGL